MARCSRAFCARSASRYDYYASPDGISGDSLAPLEEASCTRVQGLSALLPQGASASLLDHLLGCGSDTVVLCTSAVPKILPFSIMKLLFKKTVLRAKEPGRPKFKFGANGMNEGRQLQALEAMYLNFQCLALGRILPA